MTNVSKKRRRASPDDVTVVDLTCDDGEVGDSSAPSNPSSGLDGVGNSSLETGGGASVDGEIEIVDAPQPQMRAAASAAPAEALPNGGGPKTSDVDDDDIELVGTVNEQHLPHMRQHCTLHPFLPESGGVNMESRIQNNLKCCDQCYCYVCDVTTSECKDWNSHCCATDKGDTACHWKNQRALRKPTSQKNTTTTTGAAQGSLENHATTLGGGVGRSRQPPMSQASITAAAMRARRQYALQHILGGEEPTQKSRSAGRPEQYTGPILRGPIRSV